MQVDASSLLLHALCFTPFLLWTVAPIAIGGRLWTCTHNAHKDEEQYPDDALCRFHILVVHCVDDVEDEQPQAQQREQDDGEDEREDSGEDHFGLRIDAHAVVADCGHHKSEDLEDYIGREYADQYFLTLA